MDDTERHVTQKVYEHFAGPDAPPPTDEDVAYIHKSFVYQRWLLAERMNELGAELVAATPRPLKRLVERLAVIQPDRHR